MLVRLLVCSLAYLFACLFKFCFVSFLCCCWFWVCVCVLFVCLFVFLFVCLFVFCFLVVVVVVVVFVLLLFCCCCCFCLFGWDDDSAKNVFACLFFLVIYAFRVWKAVYIMILWEGTGHIWARVGQRREVGWLLDIPATCQCISNGSAQTIVRAATLKKTLHIKLAISPCHSILTPGQPVPVPIPPCAWQVTTGVAVLGHWYDWTWDKSPTGKTGFEPKSAALQADDYHLATDAVGREGQGQRSLFTVSARDRLVGLVVKASASRAEDPGFESRLRREFFGGRVIPVI